jgi:hypothetical protein
MEQSTYYRGFVRPGDSIVSRAETETVKSAEGAIDSAHRISISPSFVAKSLFAMAATLVFINTAIILANYFTGNTSVFLDKANKAFNVDLELNIPSYFSSLILLFPSLLLGAIAYLNFKSKAGNVFYWTLLACGFFFMAFDELCSVHEKLIEPMQNMLGKENLGIFHYAWVVPAVGLVIVLAAVFLRFWWNLPPRTRMMCLISGVVYLGGAVVMEMVDGNYADVHGKENLTYMLMSTFEETLEMVGSILFIKTLLDHLAANFPKLELLMGSDEAEKG